MPIHARFFAAMFVSLGTAMLVGCSQPTTCELTGTVKVDDQIATTGAISFIPTEGKGTTAGAVIKDGIYTTTIKLPLVDEKPVSAKYRVEIRVPKVVGEQRIYADDPNSPVQKVMDESLPPKFNSQSELTFEANVGPATQDFSLSTK